MPFFRNFSVLFLMGVFLFSQAGNAAPGPFLNPGQPAPKLALKDLSGTSQAFPVQGKWTVVFFWSLFCHSCIEEMPIIAEEVKKLAQVPMSAFFISLDTEKMKKGVENFLKKRNMTLHVLLEEVTPSQSYMAAEQWGVKTTPSAFLINPEGTIVFSREGPFDPEEMLGLLRASAGSSSASLTASPATASVIPTTPASSPIISGPASTESGNPSATSTSISSGPATPITASGTEK